MWLGFVVILYFLEVFLSLILEYFVLPVKYLSEIIFHKFGAICNLQVSIFQIYENFGNSLNVWNNFS